MSITVENLSKFYGEQCVLNNISFTASTGKITGFLGPNGAGKSTTLKTLTGILPVQSGQCKINGWDVQKSSAAVKSLLGYLPENNPLYLHMYVREILEFEARIRKLNKVRERVEKIIDETGLQKESHKTIDQLSKGYRQRVGLAMALIHEPEILILDEPTNGLDPNQIIEIRNLIKKTGEKKTVLLSSHIMQEVESLCDDIIIIHRGCIKAQFSMAEMHSIYPNKSLEEIFVMHTI